jgi:DnaK suppressor protein
MATSNKKGKTEKAKKVESKSKSKPKSTVKPKAVAKIKKTAKVTKTVAKKVSSPKKAVAKALVKKKVVKKAVVKKPVNKKVVVKKPVSAKLKQVKPVKTSTVVVNSLKNKNVTTAKVTKKNTGNFELGVVLRTGRRPEAIINKNKIDTNNMGEERLKYSEEELKEFEVLILDKLDKARKELVYMKEMLSKKNDQGTDNTGGTMKLLEDGADTLEKENFSQLAVRQQKFVTNLENAVARIKNGTYGICVDTGKLIPKERLKAVPHTQHSIEAKLNRR